MTSPIPHINVEKELAVCVKRIGGELIDELLPHPPPFENADYLFRNHSVIGELKRIEKDILTEPGFRKKVTAQYERWIAEKRVRRSPTGRVSTNDLPEDCRFEFFGVIKDRVQPYLKKASTQIRQTADHFGMQAALGLLLLAIDGDSGLTVDVMAHVLQRTLYNTQHYKSINGVIVFTGDHAIAHPQLPCSAGIWVPFLIEDRTEPPAKLLDQLRDAWMNRIATLTGKPVLALQAESVKYESELRAQRIRPP